MQPTPHVSRADVERVARRDFLPEHVALVMASLDKYGGNDWQPERERVQLAALKLASGCAAKLFGLLDGRDYRDLIAGAEYPGYSANWDIGGLPGPERQRIIDEDWAQYQEWLYRK
jgi:hypothetical protein